MKAEIFPYLVIGLAGFLEKQVRKYPYPDPLRYGLNNLSLALLSEYPKSTEGLIQLFERPLSTWWPGELPTAYDPNEPLVEDGELSFEAMIYLEKLSEQDNVLFQDSLSQIELIFDNHRFKQMLDHLREKSFTDMSGAQSDYVILRRFIIEHPYALQRDISLIFSQTKYINAAEVNDLYTKTSQIADILQFPDSDGKKMFWLCEECGPLRVKNGHLESIKRSVCDNHCPRNQGGWKSIAPTNQLAVLRKGVHLRVQLPGIPELSLFNWLEDCQKKYKDLIRRIILWPNIDIYDLQIQFVDSTWAVDVKDHQQPYRLGQSLAGIYREGDLHWDRGFYVYPNYREKQRRDYGDAIRFAAASNIKGVEIASEEVFKQQVVSKLRSLKKGVR